MTVDIEDIERQRQVVKKGLKVPYKRIDRALEWAAQRFPEASSYSPVFYAGHIYVEVWDQRGSASLHLFED